MNLVKEVGEAQSRPRGSSREETAGSEAARRLLPEVVVSPRTPDLETWRQIGHTNVARETGRELTPHHLSLLHQVQSGVLKATQHSRVMVQLRPPKLGAIEIAVESRSGQLQAHFHATHTAVHAWLRENMPTLRAQLAEAGLNLNDFTLSTSAQHQHDLPPALSSPWQRDKHGVRIPAGPAIRSLPEAVADASRMVDCFA